MITSMSMDFGGIVHSIVLRFHDRTPNADISVGGRLVRTVELPEDSVDESFLSLAREISAEQIKRATRSETFKVGRRSYTIDIWPVGRCLKTQVHCDEGSSDVVCWRNDGQFDDVSELFEVMKSEVRMGSIEFTARSIRRPWSDCA